MTRPIAKRLLATCALITLLATQPSEAMQPFTVQPYEGPGSSELNTAQLKPLSVSFADASSMTDERLFAHGRALAKLDGCVQSLTLGNSHEISMSALIALLRSHPHLVSVSLPMCGLLKRGQPGLNDLVESLPNLRELDCSNWTFSPEPFYSLEDISALSRLGGLQRLTLAGTYLIRNFGPLGTLTNLTFLNLMGTDIRSLSPLAPLKSLQTLYLDHTQVEDPSPLQDLVDLRTLTLTGSKISSVQSLSKLTNLETLKIGRTKVGDLRPLAGLTSLRQLDVAELNYDRAILEQLHSINPQLESRL